MHQFFINRLEAVLTAHDVGNCRLVHNVQRLSLREEFTIIVLELEAVTGCCRLYTHVRGWWWRSQMQKGRRQRRRVKRAGQNKEMENSTSCTKQKSLPLPLPNLISCFLFANGALSNGKKSLRLSKNFASDAGSILLRACFVYERLRLSL